MTRLRQLASVLISIVLGLGTSSFATAAPRTHHGPVGTVGAGDAWAQDGYGPGNAGYNPDAGRLTPGRLRPKWSVQPGTGVDGCATTPAPPLVAAGRVYFYDDGGIGAYDAATGRNLWRNTGFRLIGPTLAVAGGLVLATDSSCTSQSDYDGTVKALDARTGAVRWTARQAGTVDFFVVDRGTIVTHGYCGVCGDHQDEVVALGTSDGRRRWSRPDAGLAGPVSATGRVLLTHGNRTQAVDVRTGKTRWSSKIRWWANAAVAGRFYATDGNDLAAVNAATGQVAWRIRSGAGAVAADGRRVFVAATGIQAYDASTGRQLWSRAVPDAGRPIRAAGLLWVTTTGRAAALLSPVTGRPAAPGQLFSAATGHVVVAGGRVYTSDGSAITAYAP